LKVLHCAECGGAITAEVQKGHTYYRCSKKNRATTWCQQPYVREEVLDAEITALLKPYSLRSDWADEMLSRVKEDKKESAQSAAQVIAGKRGEIEKINLRLQTLLDSFLDGVIDRNDYTAEKSKLMSRKKSLEEQNTALSTGRATWLEPFQEWIITARNAGEIAVSGSLQEKRVLASKAFGSNLVLDCKKARGSCVKPWSLLVENSSSGGMVRDRGFEPLTPTVSM
jgi:site-specific DNA recombinase